MCTVQYFTVHVPRIRVRVYPRMLIGYVANCELFYRSHTERQILEGVVECETMRGEFERFFEHEDQSIAEERNMKVIICPAYPRRAPLHHQQLFAPHNVLYTLIWNAVGECVLAALLRML